MKSWLLHIFLLGFWFSWCKDTEYLGDIKVLSVKQSWPHGPIVRYVFNHWGIFECPCHLYEADRCIFFVFCSAVVNCWWLIGENSHGKLDPLKLLINKEQSLLDHCSHMSPPCLSNSCILEYYFHQSSAILFGKGYHARYDNCDFGSP